MDETRRERQAFFAPFVSRSARGLEFGPSYRPTFPKSEGWNILALDHCPTDELKDRLRAQGTVPEDLLALIEEVDLVSPAGDYREVVATAGTFDFVVASHVIEHTVDLLTFLVDVALLLEDGGHLLLVVPSRERTFDFYRPLSTLGDVVIAHLDPLIYERKAELDELMLAATLDGQLSWAPTALRGGRRPRLIRPPETIRRRIVPSITDPLGSWPYRDGHRWVFELETLAHIVHMLNADGFIDLRVIDAMQGSGPEFFMVLRKDVDRLEPPREDELHFLDRMAPSARAPVDGASGGLRRSAARLLRRTPAARVVRGLSRVRRTSR